MVKLLNKKSGVSDSELINAGILLTAGEGIEPSFPGSKPDVRPLHHPAKN